MEIGIYTFADSAAAASHGERLRNLVEEIELADQVGLDVFGAGEHHRPEIMVERIIALYRLFKNDRILIQMAIGAMPHANVLRAIELLGTKVAPKVKEALA